jgi:predicted phosphodiesterase
LRTAVFSDIHGNLVGLEAFLADAADRGVDNYVCLGDALQGGPQPRECLDRLAALGCPIVLGNADAFLIDLDPSVEPATEEQLDVARWTQSELGTDGIEQIRTFQPTARLDLGGGRTLLAMHGSAMSFNEIQLPSTPEAETRAAIAGVDADIIAGGHVHMQWTRPIAHRVLLNPGSVGLAYDHEQADDKNVRLSPWAEYAIVGSTDGHLSIELHRARFDPAEVVSAIERSGRPNGASFARGWG